MPLPIIAGIGLVKAGVMLAGAVGVGKGIQAVSTNNQAKSVECQAKETIEFAQEKINKVRALTNHSLEELGKEKLMVLSTTIKEFVSEFEKIKNINFQDSVGIDELSNIHISDEALSEIKTASLNAVSVLKGGVAALGAGTLTAYGAYGGIMALGKASTGIAIAKLSGVAATNATLAWLGGGALAAGGKGIAGGMLVLGGLVTGPALAVGGIIMSSHANKRLNKAYNSLDEAKVIAKQMDGAIIALDGVRTRSKQTLQLLKDLNKYFSTAVTNLSFIIKDQGKEWSAYNQMSKDAVFATVQLAKTIKIVLDTSLLDEDGRLTQKSSKTLSMGNEYLSKISNA